MNVTEFVLARIADREAAAKACVGTNELARHINGATIPRWVRGPGSQIVSNDERRIPRVDHTWGREAEHIMLNDPAAVLARCAVDRRILEEHETIRAAYPGTTIEDDPCCQTCSSYGEYPGEYPCATVALLASLDADHPDYDESWRP